MANDALFQALAQAKSQPDRWARSVNTGAQAGKDIIGGYMQGKEIKDKLDQYRLLQTPLGSMYSDPKQIPFGLSPQHTVKDLITLAPAMENYVPSSLISGAARSFGANVNDGSGGASNGNSPSTPAVAGNSGAGSQPSINVPDGGMGMKGFQNVVLPALKAGQEERQFGQRQGAEESRFERGQSSEESRFQRGKMAGVAETASKNLSTTGTIQDDINNLRGLFKGYNPVPFVGGIGAKIAAASGSPTFGTPSMQQGNAIQQVAPALGAKINYELTHRFSPGESQLLMNNVAPSPTDNEANANRKLDNLQRLVQVFQGGDQQLINMVASAIAGRTITATVPTSTNQPNEQTPSNSTTGDPMADAAISRVRNSNLDPNAKQARINGILAKSRARKVPIGQ